MSAPSEIWIDERVAKTMSPHKDEELAERGVSQIHYIAASHARELVRKAGPPGEAIIQITESQGMIFGLSNLGRLWAFGNLLNDGNDEEIPDTWGLIADAELKA